MNYLKIALYLLLSTGLSWAGLVVADLFSDPDSLLSPVFSLLAYSWGPSLAVLILQKLVYRESMARYGWNRKHYSLRWILTTLFLPVGVVIGSIAVVFFLGNLMNIPGFGRVAPGNPEFGQMLFDKFSPWMGETLLHIYMPTEMIYLFIALVALGIIAGATFNLLFNVGEEVGWRGFMLIETRSLGFLGSNLILGGFWGLWSMPYFLYHYPDPSADLLWFLFANVGYCIALSFPLAYFALKARSIYASATFTGIINNLAILSAMFVVDSNPLLGSAKGLAGMLVFLVITFFIIRYDEKFVEEYPGLFY
ncbi:MAG: hypothetical protein SF052_19825 [Bacteroidia bacterium]|nr:hypothetical protein [Bacteroidia bacterium]